MNLFKLLFMMLFCGHAMAGLLASGPDKVHSAQLISVNKQLALPLRHTKVQVEISGFVADVVVTQHYHNPHSQAIEAIYTFPLPHDAAVTDLKMEVGNRVIQSQIKRRAKAKKIYQDAKRRGQRAALLEQERPNIFTQSVSQIMPGDQVKIRIRYHHMLQYAQGHYELMFPMVVGPRYIPDGQVADAANITPPVLLPKQRSGHDIDIQVTLAAGIVIHGVHSPSHMIDIQDIDPMNKHIQLHSLDRIPNKDFILRYEVAGTAPEIGVLAHHGDQGGFFTLLIQPQQQVIESQIVPREIIFILDTSGSMKGLPIRKSKQIMRRLIREMRTYDIFNIVRFAGDTSVLWQASKANTPNNMQQALDYIEQLRGSGGTKMRKAMVTALAQPAEEGYLRMALLLTDGYIGNEQAIFKAIAQENRGARIFTLGVGSSVNRYLLDRAAVIGRGQAFYIRQDEDSDAVLEKFYQRIDHPTLAHIHVDWGNLDVSEQLPNKIPDLWAGQPIRIYGRYQRGGTDTITIKGQFGEKQYQRQLSVTLPINQAQHSAIASVWARQKIAQYMRNMAKQSYKIRNEIIEKITQLSLDFRLLTQWTSFVAVDESVVNTEKVLKTIVQPIEMPEGVEYSALRKHSSPSAPTTNTYALRKSSSPLESKPHALGMGMMGMSSRIPVAASKDYERPTQSLTNKEAQRLNRLYRTRMIPHSIEREDVKIMGAFSTVETLAIERDHKLVYLENKVKRATDNIKQLNMMLLQKSDENQRKQIIKEINDNKQAIKKYRMQQQLTKQNFIQDKEKLQAFQLARQSIKVINKSCMINAISVNGSLSYPKVKQQLLKNKKVLCDLVHKDRLDAKKLTITLTVSANGQVTNVKIRPKPKQKLAIQSHLITMIFAKLLDNHLANVTFELIF